jgi:hypothetical protein
VVAADEQTEQGWTKRRRRRKRTAERGAERKDCD